MKRKKRPRWKAVYKKMGLIMVSAGVVSVLVFLMDGMQALPSDEDGASVVKRNGYGEGERTEELQVQIGDTNEKYTVTIGERKYSEEELQELFADAADTLERLVLGENKSLDEVRKNLNLVGMIPETGIRVSWELDNYDVLDLQGVIKADSLTEEGTLVRLKALLTYGEEKMEHSFYARLYPPRLTRGERLLASLEKEVRRLDAKTQTEVVMKLPDSVDGQPVYIPYGYTAICIENEVYVNARALSNALGEPVEGDGHGFAALPAAAEALGCTVTWDGESKRMDILTPAQRGEADL